MLSVCVGGGYLRKPEEGVSSELQSFQEKYVLLTTEPSLQLQINFSVSYSVNVTFWVLPN